VLPYVGRGVGEVDSFPPKHDVRKTPAAAAADRLMKVRRVIASGNTEA
jgi:hypothetical protein